MSDYETPKDESLREDVPLPAEVGPGEEAAAERESAGATSTALGWSVLIIAGFVFLSLVIPFCNYGSGGAPRSAQVETERREAEIERAFAAEEAADGQSSDVSRNLEP